eukprot:m.2586 g.2586  ORF g.2586 m.2586 type:complete len:62 (+) comp1430_c0_seq1:687-872(+)
MLVAYLLDFAAALEEDNLRMSGIRVVLMHEADLSEADGLDRGCSAPSPHNVMQKRDQAARP